MNLHTKKVVLLLGGLVLITSGNTLLNGFVYDDIPLILENPRIHSLARPGAIFFTSYWGEVAPSYLYRPLVLLTFAIQYACAGAQPFTYHLFNLLLHLGNVLLVYFLIERMSSRGELALGAAILFAVHPIHVEAVSGIVGRAELLNAVALFASLMILMRLIRPNAAPQSLNWSISLSLAGLFLFGLCAKESAIVIPVLLFVLAMLYRSERNLFLPARASARLCMLLTLTFGIYFVLRVIAAGGSLTVINEPVTPIYQNPLFELEWPARLQGILRVAGVYLWHLVWPLRLSPDYSHNAIPLDFAPLPRTFYFSAWKYYLRGCWDVWLIGFFTLAAGLVLLIEKAACRESKFFLWLALVSWFPVSSLVFIAGTIMGDRLLYIPSLAFCFIVARCIFYCCGERRKFIGWLLIGAIGLLYGGRTIWYNAQWRDQQTLFEYAVTAYPESFQNQYVLGNCYLVRDAARALPHYQKAHELAPLEPLVSNNLGLALLQLGRFREAGPYFLSALQVRPDWAVPELNLGQLYAETNDPEQARKHFLRALELDPALAPEIRRRLAELPK